MHLTGWDFVSYPQVFLLPCHQNLDRWWSCLFTINQPHSHRLHNQSRLRTISLYYRGRNLSPSHSFKKKLSMSDVLRPFTCETHLKITSLDSSAYSDKLSKLLKQRHKERWRSDHYVNSKDNEGSQHQGYLIFPSISPICAE